ncbi:MAG: hypothetical protein ACODAU_09430 [Myxococcota bacterium]
MATAEQGGSRHPSFHASWQTLGTPPPDALVGPRVVTQHALLPVAEAAARLRESGASGPGEWLEWLEDHHAIASPVLAGTSGVRVALRPGELTLLLLDADGAARKTRPLLRCTVEEAWAWVRSELAEVGADVSVLGEGVPAAPDLPPLPESLGGALGCPDRAAQEELERWLRNADHVLRAIARASQDASAVRCPPGGRLELRTELLHPTRQGEEERRVEVGMSAGDATHPHPHFFVCARPAEAMPADEVLWWEPRDGGARAVLPGAEVSRHRDGEAQAATVDAFFERAIPLAHRAVHREWRRR